jgi:DNA-binding response OmpR family regulator
LARIADDYEGVKSDLVPRLEGEGVHVLVAEDDASSRYRLQVALRAWGYEVTTVANGRQAIAQLARADGPSLAIVDWSMPEADGLEVCRAIRSQPDSRYVYAILLTAHDQEEDVITGLDAGADDYVTKPFSLRELTSRVRAVLRRSSRADDATPITYRGEHLTADFDAVAVSVDGEQVRLTRREFELLRYLVMNKNRVVSRDRLLERVWGYDRQVETRSVDVHVGRLRSKLGDVGRQIETVVGLGYRFID